MCYVLKIPMPEVINLSRFRTDNGYVRHPNSPWREDDFSSDQALPLWLAYQQMSKDYLGSEMTWHIHNNLYRTGNGDFIPPNFFFMILEWRWAVSLCVVLQALIFKFPWRWSDSKKWFESNEDMSADYLNWTMTALFAHGWARGVISRDKLKERFAHYYRHEPNSAWFLAIANKFIDYYFSR